MTQLQIKHSDAYNHDAAENADPHRCALSSICSTGADPELLSKNPLRPRILAQIT